KPAGARQRIEARLGETRELILPVAIGEKREHQVSEPVRRRFVERAEDTRMVRAAGAPHQQGIRLLAPVASEVGVQQIDHRPQMARLLDVNLKEVAQIVKRRGGASEMALLFD